MSYADTPGLERDIRATLDVTMLQRVVEARTDGLKEVKNDLADLGESMGADPSRWQASTP